MKPTAVGRPAFPLAVLARNVAWGKKFARAMGWEPEEVKYVTNEAHLRSFGPGTMVFELAGWTDTFSTEQVNAVAHQLMFAKRRGVHVFYAKAEDLI